MRTLVASGKTLLDALFEAGDELLVREFARFELRHALLPGLQLDVVDRHGDRTLRLWLLDKALRDCGCLHRGGHHVSQRSAGAA